MTPQASNVPTEARHVPDSNLLLEDLMRDLVRDETLPGTYSAFLRAMVPKFAHGAVIHRIDQGMWQRPRALHIKACRQAQLAACDLEQETHAKTSALADFMARGTPLHWAADTAPQGTSEVPPLLQCLLGAALPDCRSALVWPLRSPVGRLLGLVVLITEGDGRSLSVSDAPLLQQASILAGGFIEYQHLYVRAQRVQAAYEGARMRGELLRLLRRSLHGQLTVPALLATTTQFLVANKGAQGAAIDFFGLTTSDRNIALSYVDARLEAHIRELLKSTPTLLEPFHTPEATSTSWSKRARAVLGEPVCLVSTPLIIRDSVCGYLMAQKPSSSVLEPLYGQEFLEDVAQLLADAIDRLWLNDEVTEAVRTREDFLGIASHELRTPLTALQLQLANMTRMIHRGPDSGLHQRIEDKLHSAARQTARLARVIDNVLDVATLRQGPLDLMPMPTRIRAFCQHVVDRWSDEAKQAACQIHLNCPDSLEGHWDAYRMEQVLDHLVANAIKYGAGGAIELTVEKDENENAITLRLRDFGIGVTPQAASRIFDQFERAVSSREFGGLGLGLYISRGIVEAHGGRLNVSSHGMQGSEFVVTLPSGHPPCHAARPT